MLFQALYLTNDVMNLDILITQQINALIFVGIDFQEENHWVTFLIF